MDAFYNLIGRLFFSRQQNWEQRRNAKTMTAVIIFSLVLAFIVAEAIHLPYNHAK